MHHYFDHPRPESPTASAHRERLLIVRRPLHLPLRSLVIGSVTRTVISVRAPCVASQLRDDALGPVFDVGPIAGVTVRTPHKGEDNSSEQWPIATSDNSGKLSMIAQI
jgi:hypothetical protein